MIDLLPRKYANIERLLRDLRKKSESTWMRAGEARALKLFHEMARRVPAYKDTLKKNRVNPDKIRTIEDFKKVPLIDKENYLRRYPVEALCWDGAFSSKRWTISSTSGSTGESFYFPRERKQDLQYAGTAELYLRTNFKIHERSTLYVDAFPMGPWIGGVFTYEAIRIIAERGKYRLSIITPGIDKKEIIRSIQRFGKQFDQVIVGCYGPFLKDTLDDGAREGIHWKKYDLKFIFSAEAFSETFRDYVANMAGLSNPCLDTLNHYGTVDQGTLAYETPTAILIRRIAVHSPRAYSRIFPVPNKLPTLAQYDPELFFFEEVDGSLLCSAASGLPLVRYDLKDHGGVIGFEDMGLRMKEAGHDLSREVRNAGIADTVWRLPFVYVHERADFSVSLYAFQVYPETVKKALQEKRYTREVTGKFTMAVRYDRRRNQVLEINVELKAKRKPRKDLKRALEEEIMGKLLTENSEYRKTYSEISKRIAPHVVFWPYEHPQYFKPGTKQRWVKKD